MTPEQADARITEWVAEKIRKETALKKERESKQDQTPAEEVMFTQKESL